MSQPEPGWHGANPNQPDFRSTLHERYRHLREVAPVSLTPEGMWRLTRHADVVRLLKNTKVGMRTSEGKLPYADESRVPRVFMLEQDPPNHTRLRKLVARYFTPKAMNALKYRIEEITDLLVNELGTGEVDLIPALAKPLPTSVICEMMGVPIEDQTTFTEWTTDLTYILMGSRAAPEQQKRANAAMLNMAGYLTSRIEERRKSLTDDLISVLIRAEEDGDRLTQAELLWQCTGLILAGFETTTGLIGNGIRQLLLHPAELERLREDPSLIDTAVEECLRFDPPIVGTSRYMHEEAEFGGFRIPKDAQVFAGLAAANRDPEEFDNPDELDVSRSPNNHLGFGGGPHMCLGTHLARLEAQLAIGTLLERYPDIQLVSEEPCWSASLFRIPAELRVRLA